MEYSYNFNLLGRTDNDPTDNTQRNLSNNRYTNYTLSNFIPPNDHHVSFATQQPAILPNGLAFGNGLNSKLIDTDSLLNIQTTKERSYDKLQLFQRPFATIPFLGKGFSNPVLESQLLFSNNIRNKPSINTVTEQSFLPLSLQPVSSFDQPVQTISNKQWGGIDSHITTDDLFFQNKPN
jgi:hypothetical protein